MTNSLWKNNIELSHNDWMKVQCSSWLRGNLLKKWVLFDLLLVQLEACNNKLDLSSYKNIPETTENTKQSLRQLCKNKTEEHPETNSSK